MADTQDAAASDFEDSLHGVMLQIDGLPRTLRPSGASLSVPRAPAPSYLGSPRAGVSEELNSRIGRSLEGDRWRVRWRTDLNPRLTPAVTLQAADRILLAGPYEWELFDLTGQSVAVGRRGAGEIVLEPTGSRFWVPSESGMIEVYDLGKGARLFATSAFGGGAFRRGGLFFREGRSLVISIEYLARPHSASPPSMSAVEAYEFKQPQQIDQYGFLNSTSLRGRWVHPSITLLAAVHAGTLVVALENRLYFSDWELNTPTVLQSEFTPEWMSLDEGGRVYLVARSPAGHALWMVTPNGERILNAPIPDTMPALIAPPIVGYNHRVYLVSGDHIRAINPDGTLAWEHLSAKRIAGAVVTADDRLLVSAGSEVASFDEHGERTALYDTNEELSTPPILTAADDILVASAQHLFCMTSKPSPS